VLPGSRQILRVHGDASHVVVVNQPGVLLDFR
jgi:hypothetical protein